MSLIASTVYKKDGRRIFATLVRLLGDFDLAEEALHDAFSTALTQWEIDGVPNNPVAWLISTARHKAIDQIRRQIKYRNLLQAINASDIDDASNPDNIEFEAIEDDHLRLLFTCCHPAIDLKIQIPLTLREVCGLTTEEIASAFLISPTTMAQRIVRGKNKIKQANIPYEIPNISDLPERLDAVLAVIYLVFNEGYSASHGDVHTQSKLSKEAIRLTQQLHTLLPDPEVKGLLALMLLHESRRKARSDSAGNIVLLEDQDRTQWDQTLINEGTSLIRQSLASRRFGFYTLQAAISAIHAQSPTFTQTDWSQITSLYTVLLQIEPSPIIELNYAVAMSMDKGAPTGLTLIDHIIDRGELSSYHLLYAARGEMLLRLGQFDEAVNEFRKAQSLTSQAPEQRMMQKKIEIAHAKMSQR